jgi:penicillin-binding protein-related factor A (putative recombinase)
MLECKETQEGTINFSKIPQLDREDGLKDYIGVEGVQPYVIVWFRKHDKVIAVPAAEALRIKNDGHASISLKMLTEKSYYIIDLPSVKLRTFLDTDYTYLLKEEVLNECKARKCFN